MSALENALLEDDSDDDEAMPAAPPVAPPARVQSMAQASPKNLQKLLQDIVQQLGKEERIEFRDFLWELKAKRDAGEIPSLTDAVYYRSEFIVGPEVWRRALELQHHSNNLPVPDGSGLAPTPEWLAIVERMIQEENEGSTMELAQSVKENVEEVSEYRKQNPGPVPPDMAQEFVRSVYCAQLLKDCSTAKNEEIAARCKEAVARDAAIRQNHMAVRASKASDEEKRVASSQKRSDLEISAQVLREHIERIIESMDEKSQELLDELVQWRKESMTASLRDDDAAGKATIAALRAELVRRDTVEVFDVDSGETTKAPAPKRQRTDATSGIAVLAENAEAAKSLLVRVKDEKQRAEGEKEDAQDLLSPLNKTINALQTKVDELAAFAKAGGLDPHAIDAIKYRSNV